MTSAHRKFYERRIAKVLDYIGAHLDGDLSLEMLSRVAGFSKFHFHRQFRSYTGVSVGKLVALARLKHASMQLFLTELRVLDIALDSGFDSPEAFARAFKKTQGQSPSDFRRDAQWEDWSRVFRTPINTRTELMQTKIINFEETRVAVLEHRGAPSRLMETVARFIAWRKSCDASPVATSMTLGIAFDDPDQTDPADFRFDVCGSLQTELPDNAFGVIEKKIPAGRCAVARHHGSTDLIGKTVHRLFSEWLPQSGEHLRDYPIFFHYVERMPTVSEHEQITDVYLPLA